jgi:tetratricopeptide (TPR) repeat protein
VQARFFEGLCRVLVALMAGHTTAAHRVLFLDDIQWADAASVDLLAYLIRRLPEHPLFLLLSWRNADVPPDHRLRQLLAEAQRGERATLVQPARLGPELIRELAQAYLPGAAPISEQMVTQLYAETEGVPYFLVEYLAAMASGVLAAESTAWSLPDGVRDLLRSRVSVLGEIGRQVLTAAAVIGRSFEFETVRATSGRGEEETVIALEELLAQGLVQEVHEGGSEGVPAYDFHHEKLRTLVYDETTLARRRLLHRRVAEALVAQTRGARDAHALAGQIAGHYLVAGDERSAAEYYWHAGERARTLYANTEALAHLETALALGHPEPAILHERIGDLQTLRGEYSAALKSYETAAALRPPAETAPIEHKIAAVYARRGDWELAESHLDAAIAAWGEASPTGELARAFADRSLIARQRGQLDNAQEMANRALGLAGVWDDRPALAQAHNILGLLASDQGRQEEALLHLERSLAYAERLNEPSARIAALNNLAFVHAAHGDRDQARDLTETALALCAAQGDRHHEAALHNNLADLLHAAGNREAAMAHLKDAVRIYAEIGVEAGAVQPEIWKLSEW